MAPNPNPLIAYEDVLGWEKIDEAPGTGYKAAVAQVGTPGQAGYVAGVPAVAGHWNIDDPSWQEVEGKWGTDPLNMNLPTLVTPPKTCQDKCDDAVKLRHENCSLLRKRVAEALKKAGCPSKVIAFKVAKKVCTTKKAKPKKKTTKKK